jgi:ATP-dependent DNA ligase
VLSADGTTDFSVLQNELKGRSAKIVMVAFDLLYLNGDDLRKLALFEHKALLKRLIADNGIQFSESFEVESVSQSSLKDKGFSTFPDQNPQFELRRDTFASDNRSIP